MVHRLVYLSAMLRTMRAVLLRHHETRPTEMQMCTSRLYKMINSSSGYREDYSHCPSGTAILITIDRAIILSRRESKLVALLWSARLAISVWVLSIDEGWRSATTEVSWCRSKHELSTGLECYWEMLRLQVITWYSMIMHTK